MGIQYKFVWVYVVLKTNNEHVIKVRTNTINVRHIIYNNHITYRQLYCIDYSGSVLWSEHT